MRRLGKGVFGAGAEVFGEPLVAELTRQVGREIGEADGVLVIDPSSFPKKGAHVVGVCLGSPQTGMRRR